MGNIMFSSLMIGKAKIKNRFGMSSQKNCLSTLHGYLTDRSIDFIVARAQGGFGLLFTNPFSVDPDYKCFPFDPSLNTDDQIPSNQIVTQKIHELDSKIFITITHPGLDCSISYSDKPGLTPTLTYTNYLSSYYQQVITVNEIKKIETQFAAIAKRAKIAGYDGLLISARKLSLLSLFLSPWYNQRSDDYGGSKEKRFRIIAEIYKKVRKEVGPDYPMGLELDATQLFPPGRTVEDTAELCKDCQNLGFDYILLNRHFAAEESHYNLAKKEIYFSQDCDFGKKIKAGLSIPVLLNTAFYDFDQMEKLVNDKYADLLCLGTESLAEPNYPKFCQEGRFGDITPCIHCSNDCSESIHMIGTKRCITNPIPGNESLLKNLPKHKAHIAVVGQEISSIFTALYTARSGYQVDFYHENSALDMTSILKKISPNEYLKFNQYLVNQLKEYRVREFDSHLPSAAELITKKYALTIVGCGAKPIDPDIKGINSPNVFLAQDVFFGDIKPGENIVVLGTGEEACTCVKYLIRDRKKITIVSEDSDILHDMDGFPNPDFVHDLEKNAVDIYTSSKVTEIKNTEVIINTPKGVVKVRADQVIIAFGYKDGTALETDLIKLGYPSCNIISLKKKTTVGLRSYEGLKKL